MIVVKTLSAVHTHSFHLQCHHLFLPYSIFIFNHQLIFLGLLMLVKSLLEPIWLKRKNVSLLVFLLAFLVLTTVIFNIYVYYAKQLWQSIINHWIIYYEIISLKRRKNFSNVLLILNGWNLWARPLDIQEILRTSIPLNIP